MKNYKKYLIISAIVLTLIFPEYMFTGLGIIGLIVILLLIIADIAFDIYIIVALFIENLRKK